MFVKLLTFILRIWIPVSPVAHTIVLVHSVFKGVLETLPLRWKSSFFTSNGGDEGRPLFRTKKNYNRRVLK